MKIKNGLAFSKSSRKLVGFCDLGSFNSELSEMAMFLSGKKSKSTPELASHMLVFMARPVFKPSLCNAPQFLHYWQETIFPVVWEVIEALEINFLPVMAVTSDDASRFYKFCKDRGIDYKTRNPFSTDRYIYFLRSTPPSQDGS